VAFVCAEQQQTRHFRVGFETRRQACAHRAKESAVVAAAGKLGQFAAIGRQFRRLRLDDGAVQRALVAESWYRTGSVTPTAAASSRVVAPRKPFSEKSRVAASTMAVRRSAFFMRFRIGT